MLNLYTLSANIEQNETSLSDRERFSLLYHNLFDYPLNVADLIKWLPSEKFVLKNKNLEIVSKNGYYYLQGRDGLVYKRLLRKRISQKKRKIAQKAAKLLSILPGVKMVGLTGSLAMDNSSDDSDIDMLIITKSGRLWSTRLLSYLLLKIMNISIRVSGHQEQKDRMCLNMWIDESDLDWYKSDRNIYTAHEIAQIRPLVNKNKTYESFLLKNSWILNYWPNSVKISKVENLNIKTKYKLNNENNRLGFIEDLLFRIQYLYMKRKITRETVTNTRAFFHPQDWGKFVLNKIGQSP